MTTHHRNLLRRLLPHTALLLLAVMPLTTSCIKEDRSNCPQTKILFYYDADGTRNVIGQYIRRAVIYVFNAETGDYVGHADIPASALTSTEPLPLDLREGKYRLVVWGEEGEKTLLPEHGESFEESVVSHPLYKKSRSTMLDTHDNLYYSTVDVDMDNPKAEPYVLDFCSAHANIEVYVKGWNKADDPQIFLHGFTPEYSFAKQALEVGTISYQPEVSYNLPNGYYVSRLATLRFYNPTTSVLEVISRDGSIRHSFSFWDYMQEYAKHKGIVYSKIEELTIPVLVEVNGLNIAIRIPRWESGDIVPDI